MSLLDGRVVAVQRRPARPVAPALPVPVAMRDLRFLTWLPVGAVLTLLTVSLAAPRATARHALALAVVGALVGLPHGAVDHLVPLWSGTARSGRRLLLFLALYAAGAVLALALFLALPTAMLVVFLVLSALHFGRGEVVTAAERAGRPVPGARAEWPTTVAFGSAVVGLLLWAHPSATDPYLRPVSPWLATHAASTRPVGLVVVGLAVAWGAAELLRLRRGLELSELALLVTALVLCPPLAAFGVYFGLWHAVRHTGRLLDLARRGSPYRNGWGPAAARVARASLIPTLLALAAIAVLWSARTFAGLQSEVAVLLALTFPHAAVVWVLDRRAAG